MHTQYGSQLHYWCCFDLAPSYNGGWTDVVKTIREWISKRCGYQEDLGRRSFFVSLDWRMPGTPRLRVRTMSCIGNGTDAAPECWAMRFEHPCGEIGFRQWRTDVGLTIQPDHTIRFVLTTAHGLLPEFIGDEPPNPNASAPGVVSALIRNPRFNARLGSQRLTLAPSTLKVGAGNELARVLADPVRPPIVFASVGKVSKLPKINPAQLAGLLAGAANVYTAVSGEVDEELNWLLPKHLRCENGMVRVYQPGASLDPHMERDGVRHRYFTPFDIDQRSPAAVSDIIVRGIVRRARGNVTRGIATIEDVATVQRELRMAHLKAESQGKPSEDWLTMLEEDNAELSQKVTTLTAKTTELEAEVGSLGDEAAALEHRIGSLEYERDQCQARANDAEEKARLVRTQLQAFQALSDLPGTLREVVDLMERLHAGRIYFTPRAKKAADDASITDMWTAWKLLWAMSTTLHDLYFGAKKNDAASIEREFRAKSTFELSHKEGKQTNADAKLVALRKDEWDGAAIDITPHVKWGVKEPKILRVHYCAHAGQKAIVVGHCGDHMDTSGTRKQR